MARKVSDQSKDEIIDRLSSTQKKITNLETQLRKQGENAKADTVAKLGKALQKQVDSVIRNVMKEWSGSSDSLIADIKSANGNLQGCIRDIKKKKQTAKRISKAIGLIADVIGFAKDVVQRF